MTEPTSMSEAYREMHLGTKQLKLEDVRQEIVVPSFSDPDHNHLITIENGVVSCGCDGFLHWGHCHHASVQIQKIAFKTKNLCALIMDLKSHARYRTFEDVMAHFSGSSDEEFLYLSAIALGIAYEREVCADDLHYATRERFNKKAQIVGSALGCLQKRGFLMSIGRKRSERAACHHRKIERFVITDKGRDYLNGGSMQ